MTPKKNPAFDLEHQRTLFFSIGLVLSMAVVTVAFEWKTYEDTGLVELTTNLDDRYEDVMDIPMTQQPPPPPPKVMQQPTIVAVADEIEIKDDLEITLDIEITEATAIEDTYEYSVADEPEEEVFEEVFLIVEESPSPKGGMVAFYEYIATELVYPREAVNRKISGKVFVQFVVDKDGSLTDFEILKGIGGGCDEEALRVLKNAPKWKPGKQRGIPVKVRMVIPIGFEIN